MTCCLTGGGQEDSSSAGRKCGLHAVAVVRVDAAAMGAGGVQQPAALLAISRVCAA
jgi:hypothetical protein